VTWMKVKDAAKYAGVSIRTFRDWLRNGLKHSKLPSGMILISSASIDEYLRQFEVCETSKTNRIITELLEGLI
jgi:predicted site-specific integrase-resolvase